MAQSKDLSAQQLLERLAWAAREPDEDEDVGALVERLEAVATPPLLPALLGLLDDDDAGGVGWHVLYLAERFDDDYLDALLAALPTLIERGPQWAQTAVLRIVNTAGEPDDCTTAFAERVHAAKADVRKTLLGVLDAIVEVERDGLAPAQLAAIERLRVPTRSGKLRSDTRVRTASKPPRRKRGAR